MGEVFVASQLTLGRLVAIKRLKLDPGGDAEARLLRFRRKGRKPSAHLNHPHVLTAFDFGTTDGRPYLVMEYVAGGDLRKLMRPGVPMEVARARAILGRVRGRRWRPCTPRGSYTAI